MRSDLPATPEIAPVVCDLVVASSLSVVSPFFGKITSGAHAVSGESEVDHVGRIATTFRDRATLADDAFARETSDYATIPYRTSDSQLANASPSGTRSLVWLAGIRRIDIPENSTSLAHEQGDRP